jgi:hypothetical protein
MLMLCHLSFVNIHFIIFWWAFAVDFWQQNFPDCFSGSDKQDTFSYIFGRLYRRFYRRAGRRKYDKFRWKGLDLAAEEEEEWIAAFCEWTNRWRKHSIVCVYVKPSAGNIERHFLLSERRRSDSIKVFMARFARIFIRVLRFHFDGQAYTLFDGHFPYINFPFIDYICHSYIYVCCLADRGNKIAHTHIE